MITKAQSYQVGDRFFPTLEEAQKHELRLLVSDASGAVNDERNAVLDLLLSKREKVLDILTTTPRSKPKARAINGAKRKPKVLPASAATKPPEV